MHNIHVWYANTWGSLKNEAGCRGYRAGRDKDESQKNAICRNVQRGKRCTKSVKFRKSSSSAVKTRTGENKG